MSNFELLQGDCLELMKNIPDNSIDLVLTDPPYGTMSGENRSGRLREPNRIDDCRKWDVALDEKKDFKRNLQSFETKWKSGTIFTRAVHK